MADSAVSSLTLPPEKSVLKLKVGDEVKLTEADFVRLSKAFFAEIEKKYLNVATKATRTQTTV